MHKRLFLIFTILFALLTPPQTAALPEPHKVPQLKLVAALPVPTDQPLAELVAVYVPITGVVPNCGDNEYANYVYMHESGCNTYAVNSIGCRGIGQACPGDKLPCDGDYACQNAWFNQYAQDVYGGWYGAYEHWLAYSWW